MKICNVAFLGFGVVGSKVYEMIQENKEEWKKQYQVDVHVVKILVRDKSKKRGVKMNSSLLTDRAEDLIADPKINVCFECMGGNGLEATRSNILQLLQHGKDIIMASKKCLALYGDEIQSTALRYGRIVRFEATVGGGIPIIQSIQSTAYGEEIQKIYGIFNATSNYILTQMTLNGMSYDAALDCAKAAGYAENDPSEDVDGLDAAFKLMLLVKQAMGRTVEINQIDRISIQTITPKMIVEAKQNHEVFKQVASAHLKKDGSLSVRVEPKRVSEESILNCVQGSNNIICIEGTRSGLRAFYGQGAGADPTAAVMIDDLLTILLTVNDSVIR